MSDRLNSNKPLSGGRLRSKLSRNTSHVAGSSNCFALVKSEFICNLREGYPRVLLSVIDSDEFSGSRCYRLDIHFNDIPLHVIVRNISVTPPQNSEVSVLLSRWAWSLKGRVDTTTALEIFLITQSRVLIRAKSLPIFDSHVNQIRASRQNH